MTVTTKKIKKNKDNIKLTQVQIMTAARWIYS